MGCRETSGAMLLLLLLLVAACRPAHSFSGSCDTCGLRPVAYHYNNMRVVGGTEALHGSWPWIVSIQNPRFAGTGHMCGGSLITPQWVLSAAHCFGRPNYILESRVVIGANDLTHLGQEVEVHTIRRAILHEYFNNKTMINDIALLELDRPVHCSYYIQLACVPDPSLRVSELTDCYVSGWGHMGMRSAAPTQTAEVLQEAKVHLLDLNLCNSSHWYAGVLHTHNLCAGYPQGGIDTCQGDSGGPLMCRDNHADYFWLVGVTSWGKGCGRAFRPGIYTSTQHFYNWILLQMRAAAHPTSRTWSHFMTTSAYYHGTNAVPTQPSVSDACPYPVQKLREFFTGVQNLLQTLWGSKA
ncbi:acrosin [Tympanuchus pallidicinctus]|uniref:acrosin n=1 Tax=Tympanuchus pallidicinctus TaxID=109042 RepID=UPI0022874B80|nr:acrosin [Tympanuchus pallidicinctus]